MNPAAHCNHRQGLRQHGATPLAGTACVGTGDAHRRCTADPHTRQLGSTHRTCVPADYNWVAQCSRQPPDSKDWPPEAYNPTTNMVHIPANNNLCSELPSAENPKYKAGELCIGIPLEGVMTNVRVPNPDQTIGELQAWDMSTGKQAWVHKFKSFLWTPLMTTASNLVFAGGTTDRMFRAFDARNGKMLWETPAPSGVHGVPSSYMIDGERYIAAQSGSGVDGERLLGAINTVFDATTMVPQGGALMVYKLKK